MFWWPAASWWRDGLSMTPTLPNRDIPSISAHPEAPGQYAESGDVAAEREVSLISVAVVLLRHRWLIIISALLASLLFGLSGYSSRPLYTSTATFTPRARSAASAGTAILQELGLGGGSNTAYYTDLIKSREILGPVVESRFSFRTPTGTVTESLIGIYDIKDKRPRYAKAEAIERLSSNMVSASQINGMMKLSVTSEDPALSATLASRILQQLNRFNLATRQQQATSEREFIESQVAEASQRLRNAEDQLQTFLSENRNFTQASSVAFELDRLRRAVSMRQELYTSLAKSLDEARIEEVRDSPVLTVIEPAEPALLPDRPVWPGRAIVGLFVGLLIGSLIAFVHSYFARQRENETSESEELDVLKRQTLDDLKHFWRPLGRILSTGRT
ncbi:MAG: hypothetical protein H0U64_03795 [Gemmatimonadaceae bacterium]|nr:hypothetical protein [Gemmatimonadaceae bacterium]